MRISRHAFFAPVLTALAFVGCGNDHPIAAAALLDDDYAIAICGEPTHEVPDGIPGIVHGKHNRFQSVRLQTTGVEYCAVVDDFTPGETERIVVTFPASSHGIDELHVYHQPPRADQVEGQLRRAVFTTVPLSRQNAFEFKVVPTQIDEPTIVIGAVRADDPLLVPTDGLY